MGTELKKDKYGNSGDGELMVVGDNPASVIEELIDKN